MVTRLSAFSLRDLDDADVISRSNTTRAALDLSRSIVDLFNDRVQANPDAVACIDGPRRTTFTELDAWSNRLAHALLAQGVGADVPVGILLERSVEHLVAILGVLKAGGCYVPLDPRYPADYLKLVVRDAAPQVVISSNELRGQLRAAQADILGLDDLPVRKAPCTDPGIRLSPVQLAYIMYTSGSSGTPKGVMVPHQQLLNCLASLSKRVPFCADEIIAQKTSTAFAISTKELFSGLLAGVAQVFISDEVTRDPGKFVAELARAGVTRLYTFPSQLEAILAHAKGSYEQLRCLRHLFVSIEPWPAELLDELRRAMPWVTPWYIYGCTEINDVTYCDPGCTPSGTGFVPIGRPIQNTRIFVLNDELRPVPLGAVGEMYVESLGIARGYWNLPDLTATRFVANPHDDALSPRLYRTGDLARYLPDGSLEFLGRRDDEVKVRGYRVDVRQVEKALTDHLAVREAAVVGLSTDQGKGKTQLVAYVVAKSAAPIDIASLRDHLANCLPAYMVPTLFQVLPKIPRLPNDKIDRLSLPDPVAAESSTDYVAPRSATEKALAEIWIEVLRQGTASAPTVGQRDDFFDLGGHSLLAAQMFSRIRDTFGVELPLNLLFEHPVLEAFAQAVESALGRQTVALPSLVSAVDRNEAIPLSFVQERLWFVHEHMAEQRTSYNVAFAADMRGMGFSVAALRAAVNGIVARHETLRTTFAIAQSGGDPVQRIADSLWLDVPLEVVDLAEVQARKAAHAAHVFDLAKGPLLKVSILRVSPEHHVFMLNMHHIICDGWSIGVMMRDLFAYYVAAETGAQPNLPALEIQYADYAVWQRKRNFAEHLDYWRSTLEGYEDGLSLPYDFPRPRGRAWRAGIVRHRYNPKLAAALTELSKRHQATLFMVLMASVAVVLNRYTSRRDLCIGTTVAGRDQLALENLVGFFVNILAIRLDLRENPSLDTLVERTRAQLIAAMEHRELPFEHVLAALKKQPDSSQIPLVPVMVRHQNFPTDRTVGTTAPDLVSGEIEFGERTTPNELDLQFTGDGSALEITVEYAAELFSERTIVRLIKQHEQVLHDMVSRPDARLSDFNLQDIQEGSAKEDSEKDDFEKKDSDKRDIDALDVSKGVLDLFGEQVRKSPDAPACVSAAGSLTYAELERRANQVARYLVGRGVTCETPVGVLFERSADLLIATLGVLKAGGCYVPLDPQYPHDYIHGILTDAEPRFVIASSQLRAKITTTLAPIVDLNDPSLTSLDSSPLALEVHPDQLAYLMYTSGSTGRPKGVMVPHRQILAWLDPLWERAPFEKDEVVAQKTSTAFAIAVKEMFAGLLAGVPQLPIDDEVVRDVATLVRVLEQGEVSRLYTFPSQLDAIFRHVERKPERLKALRHLFVSIEPCPVALLDKVRSIAPWITIWYIYGCTEVNDITYCEPDEQVSDTGFVPIGRAIARTHVFLLDAELRQVPVGALGEIYVASPGLARGYWRQPELSAERFVANPFGKPGTKLYRTGDLARRLDNGALEFLGRRDYETKIRGHRVDIRQVEKVLAGHDGVAEAAIIGWPPHAKSPELLAYVVPTATQAVDARMLREHLLSNLPTYMVPTMYQFLHELPRLPNGKLDRVSLPSPSNLQGEAEYVAPRTATEKRLANMWSRLLKHGELSAPRVGALDNFFDLGGHSLLAEHVLADVRSEFGVDIRFRTLFESPRLEDFSRAVDDAMRWQNTGEHMARVDDEASAIVALSPNADLPKLFCVHPVGGQALVYRELGQSLGHVAHVHALHSDGIRTFDAVDDLAAFYADEILKVQPRGGFCLLGWSSGGLLAVAIAKALQRREASIDYLGLVETNPIPAMAAGPLAPLLAATNILGTIRGRGFTAPEIDSTQSFIHSKGWTEEIFVSKRKREALRELARYFDVAITEESLAFIETRLETTRYYLDLLAGYGLEDCSESAILYRAKDANTLTSDPMQANAVMVPGNHYSVLQGENARYLAARIAERLASLAASGAIGQGHTGAAEHVQHLN